MRNPGPLVARLAGALATGALFTFFASAGPAIAQTCPTAGAGTTCFGGQYYCPSNQQCYNPPSCSGNQYWDCNACGCACDTVNYPCGGCTAASSTAGASCSGNSSCPTNGTYQNQCGTVGCPAGRTLCPTPSPGVCVLNRTCPAGTTWDVCTDTCGTPNVLLSPSWVQSGYIQISGEVRSTAGNLRLDSATGAGAGDVYLANGKAIRVDGSGVTSVSIGNWGSGGTGINVNLPSGRLFGTGVSTIAADTSTLANTVETSQLCLGNGTNCRTTWPSSTDFDPTYINAGGDTMTGDLNLTGATTDLFVAGNVGIGTITPGAKLDVNGTARVTGFQLTTGAAAGQVLMSDASGNATWQAPPGIGGSGTTNFIPKFTGATTIGNSIIQQGVSGGIGIGMAPARALDVAGTAGVSAQTISSGTSLRVTNNTDGKAIHASTPSAYNGVPAILAENTGQGPGLEVYGGTNAYAMNVRAGANNPAIDAANYEHSSTNTLATIVNLRRGTSGTPAVGMGASLGFSLEGSGGSNYQSGYIGSVISSLSPHNTDLVLAPASNASAVERMRITAAGDVGIGTTTPGVKLDVNGAIRGSSSVASTGTVYGYNSGSPGFGVYGRSANSYGVYGYTDGAAYGVYGAGGASALAGVYGTTNSGTGVEGYSGTGRGGLFSSSNIGVQASGTNYGVYSTSTSAGGYFSDSNSSGYAYAGYGDGGLLGYGNSYGVFGYDLNDYVYGYLGYAGYSFYGSGVFNNYGDMRIDGKHAFRGSDSWLRLNQDGAFGSGTHTPGFFNAGSMTVGADYSNPGGGNLGVTGSIRLGGVWRSSWPSLYGYVVTTYFYTWQGAGWKRVYCPGGYVATGASGYNCESGGGDWECSSTVIEDTSVQYYYSAEATAYTWTKCVAVY